MCYHAHSIASHAIALKITAWTFSGFQNILFVDPTTSFNHMYRAPVQFSRYLLHNSDTNL